MSDAGNDEYNIPLLKQPKQKKTKKIVEVVEEVKEPEIKKKARPPANQISVPKSLRLCVPATDINSFLLFGL